MFAYNCNFLAVLRILTCIEFLSVFFVVVVCFSGKNQLKNHQLKMY